MATVPSVAATMDEPTAKRLHMALMILSLNPDLRQQFKQLDPSQFPPAHILSRIYTQWPELYNQVKTNVNNTPSFNKAAHGFAKVFFSTAYNLPVHLKTNLYSDPTICPCSSAASDSCDSVSRLLG